VSGAPAEVVGSDPETAAIARGLGLRVVRKLHAAPAVVVASSAADVDAVRDAVTRDRASIAGVVALRLEERLVVALYDLGLPVAFGYCSRADLDLAIAAAPDPEGRNLAATLAGIEHALSVRPATGQG
jgi:hypothetical protein